MKLFAGPVDQEESFRNGIGRFGAGRLGSTEPVVRSMISRAEVQRSGAKEWDLWIVMLREMGEWRVKVLWTEGMGCIIPP